MDCMIENYLVATMSSDMVIYYLGKEDSWLDEYANISTSQKVRNALVERYNKIHGTNIPIQDQ